MSRIILGITGLNGSGKSTVARYLAEEHNFKHFSARKLFTQELKRRGIEPTRLNMNAVADEFRISYGPDFLIKKAFEEISKNEESYIIESIRVIAEVDTLKEKGGELLCINVPPEIRYKRAQERNSSTDNVSYQEFIASEDHETNENQPAKMNIRKVVTMADYVVDNIELEGLKESIDNLIFELRERL